MTHNPSPLTKADRIARVVDEVLEAHAGEIGTHYDGCWKRHVACLAFYIKAIGGHDD